MAGFPKYTRRFVLAWIIGAMAIVLPLSVEAYPTQNLVISEIMFDAVTGNDTGNQWVEIYNGTGADIDLSLTSYSLGWGRFDYTRGTFDLNTGIIEAGTAFLVGGPTEPLLGGVPQSYDIAGDFVRNLPLGNGSNASGVGLFAGAASGIDASSVPIHAVMYGRASATNNLLDEQGFSGGIVIETQGLLATGESLQFTGSTNWAIAATPTPGLQVLPVPEPGTASLLALGLALLGCSRKHEGSRSRAGC